MIVLNEAKQVGVLYHVTDIDGFNGIFHSNKSGKYKDFYTAFTRDPRYTYVFGTEKYFVIQLVTDGNKLSSRYKITPFASPDSYVNGKRIKLFSREDGAEVCWKFFGLDKKYTEDEWIEGSYFSSFDPSYSVDSDELKGHDLIWLGNDGETIYVRAKNPNQYSELKPFGKLKVEPYTPPFESQGENNYE